MGAREAALAAAAGTNAATRPARGAVLASGRGAGKLAAGDPPLRALAGCAEQISAMDRAAGAAGAAGTAGAAGGSRRQLLARHSTRTGYAEQISAIDRATVREKTDTMSQPQMTATGPPYVMPWPAAAVARTHC